MYISVYSMEKRKLHLQHVAQRLRKIGDEIDQKELKLSFVTSIKRHFGILLYLIMSCYNFIRFYK